MREQLHRLRSCCTFRVATEGLVEVHLDGQVTELSMDLYRLALEFAGPQTEAAVYTNLDTGCSETEFGTLIEHLSRQGVLEPVHGTGDGPAKSRNTSIAAILHAEALTRPALLARVGDELNRNRAVMIPNAFCADVAERVHAALGQTTAWRLYEGLGIPFFQFRHRNLYDRAQFPPALSDCAEVFGSEATKLWATNLTNSDCSGPPVVGASLYLPGDHSLPHSDYDGLRNVSYVWHLAKEWQPEWGGNFVWCPNGSTLVPQFNSLVLFKVSAESMHFVSTVAPDAMSKRLCISGWWQRAKQQGVHDSTAAAEFIRRGILPGCYGTATAYLDGCPGAVLL